MRFLVLGGAGFVGSNCVDDLLSNGHDVRVVDNFSTGFRSNLRHVEGEIEIVRSDIRDLEAIRGAMSSVDFVYHLAALGSVPRSIDDPISTNDTNITGTLNVLVAARDAEVGRVVFSSSSSAYGANSTLPKTEEMTGEPLAPYALSKVAGEHYCRLFHELYDLDTVRVRFFNVFGPRQTADHVYAAVIPKFIDAALARRQMTIHGDGLQSRDFTYVDNVVSGLRQISGAASSAVSGEVFNMAAGRSTSVIDVAREVASALDVEAVWTHVESRPGDIRNSLADNSKAAEAFGYEASIDVQAGIRKTVAAFRRTKVSR